MRDECYSQSHAVLGSQAPGSDVHGVPGKQSLPAPDDGLETGAILEMVLLVAKVRRQAAFLRSSLPDHEKAHYSKVNSHVASSTFHRF